MRHRLLLLTCVWVLSTATVTWAQDAAPVYRCGNSYSAKPCAGAKLVDAADSRGEDQRAAGQAAATRDAATVRRMAAERRADERAAASSGAANIGPQAARPAAAAASKAHTADRKKARVKRVVKTKNQKTP